MLHPRERTLLRYADGDAPNRMRTGVARHLLGCARCRAIVDALTLIRASVTDPPMPPDTVLVRALERRAAGERVLLPTSGFGRARRIWRIAVLTAAGVAAILAVSLVPAGQVGPDQVNVGEEECMSGLRSVFSALVLGTGLACADAPTAFMLPDSAYRPVMALDASRVAAGRYVYETVTWTDGLVESPQARMEYTLLPAELRGTPVWEARGARQAPYVEGRYVRRQASEAWFDRATLEPLRYVSHWWDGSPWIEFEVTPDSIIQSRGRPGLAWRRFASARLGGIPLLGFSVAHEFAVLAALPLAEGWAGQIDNIPAAVVGREEISVPAGTFLCWRLESPAGATKRDRWPAGLAWRAWVAVDRPLLVRTELGPVADRRETRLVSYEPAAR
jgi:hypothetical protein